MGSVADCYDAAAESFFSTLEHEVLSRYHFTTVSTAVIEFCYGPLADNPYRVGKALRLQLEGLHNARRGDFRVIYRISHTEVEVVVIAVEHRSDVYRQH
jgi:mRNA interferase RelE/StbE